MIKNRRIFYTCLRFTPEEQESLNLQNVSKFNEFVKTTCKKDVEFGISKQLFKHTKYKNGYLEIIVQDEIAYKTKYTKEIFDVDVNELLTNKIFEIIVTLPLNKRARIEGGRKEFFCKDKPYISKDHPEILVQSNLTYFEELMLRNDAHVLKSEVVKVHPGDTSKIDYNDTHKTYTVKATINTLNIDNILKNGLGRGKIFGNGLVLARPIFNYNNT